MKKLQVELLAPAGSFEGLKAAINAGCDAVYIGGTKFGARAYADNPEEDMLIKSIEYAHMHDKAVYLTVNTLLKNKELENELYDYLKPYYEHGLDAVIVQDIGVFTFIKEHFPDIDIHASTQMTICNYEGAKYLKELGASRVVTARELSCNEIREINNNVDVEIESFVHGALCYCYSGQCFLSSFIGGRSGNRGRCAQPCRLPYKVLENNKIINKPNENFILSPKDMCTLDIIPDIIESGVYSFKIEGRMKKPEYAAGVVRIYRKYIDMYLSKGKSGYKVSSKDKQELFDIFNRCGFNEGYYKQHNGRNMITLKEPQKRTRDEALFNDLSSYIDSEDKIEIDGYLYAKPGSNLLLELKYKDFNIKCSKEEVQKAQNQPMSAERIKEQLSKTGATAFTFKNINVECEGDIFIPMKQLNEIRREGLSKLEDAILSQYYRTSDVETANNYTKGNNKTTGNSNKTSNKTSNNAFKPNINVYVESLQYLDAILEFDEVNAVYIDSNILDMNNNIANDRKVIERCHTHNKRCYIMLPYIFRNTKKTSFLPYKAILDENIDGVVVKSYDEFNFLKEQNFNKEIILDYNVYAYNSRSHEFWKNQGISYDTTSLELNYRELEEYGINESELIVYGYMPVMISAQCVHNTINGCNKVQNLLKLKDRLNKEFLIKNNCKYCYNTIYNCQPLVLLDCYKDIKSLSPMSIRLNFTNEKQKDVKKILSMYINRFIYNKPVDNDFEEFTRGHFKRGIE